jgi:hypothetical protein
MADGAERDEVLARVRPSVLRSHQVMDDESPVAPAAENAGVLVPLLHPGCFLLPAPLIELRPGRADPDAAVEARHYELGLGSGGPTISVKYEIQAGGTTHDAYTLAKQCWEEWQTYLAGKALISGARGVLPRLPPRWD